MDTRVSCSWCHTLAAPGRCPSCGHDNDRPRMHCECGRCKPTRSYSALDAAPEFNRSEHPPEPRDP